MYQDPMKLRDYTTAQLIEELARRANGCATKKPEHWCHDCTHFLTWLDGKEPNKPCPDDYNPCLKGHVMRFLAPEGFDDEYGFYLRVCPDRDLKRSALHHEEREDDI